MLMKVSHFDLRFLIFGTRASHQKDARARWVKPQTHGPSPSRDSSRLITNENGLGSESLKGAA